jgi:hypothetical protein
MEISPGSLPKKGTLMPNSKNNPTRIIRMPIIINILPISPVN